MLPLAYPNPLRCASPAARYSHSYCLSAFESAFEKASFKRGFLVSRAITKLRVWHTSTAAGSGLDLCSVLSRCYYSHKSSCSTVLPIGQPCSASIPSEPKTLAFCAARPHIVAVR